MERHSEIGTTRQDNAMALTRTRQNVGGNEVFVDSDSTGPEDPSASIKRNDVDRLGTGL